MVGTIKAPQKAIYTLYISGIYCQLGDYILTTTLYKNQNNPLKSRRIRRTQVAGMSVKKNNQNLPKVMTTRTTEKIRKFL